MKNKLRDVKLNNSNEESLLHLAVRYNQIEYSHFLVNVLKISNINSFKDLPNLYELILITGYLLIIAKII